MALDSLNDNFKRQETTPSLNTGAPEPVLETTLNNSAHIQQTLNSQHINHNVTNQVVPPIAEATQQPQTSNIHIAPTNHVTPNIHVMPNIHVQPKQQYAPQPAPVSQSQPQNIHVEPKIYIESPAEKDKRAEQDVQTEMHRESVQQTSQQQYGQEALLAQLQKASADIDDVPEELEETPEIENESAKDEALSRVVDDGNERPQKSLATRLLTTVAVIAVVAAVGYFGGAFLAANVPAIGSAISGAAGAIGSIGAHATAFLQGAGLLSISAPTAGIAVGGAATGGSVALTGGIIGAVGATVLALKANVMQMIGLETAVNPAFNGTDSMVATASKKNALAAGPDMLEPNGMDTVDTSIVDANRSSSMQAKMGSKAAQYATKHDQYATSRGGSKSWADRVGSKSAEHASYADALEEARAMQAELTSEATR